LGRNIAAQHPSTTVRAAYAKNKRDDTLPLKAETANARSSRMLQLDLAAAGIPYRDSAGRVVDFHALRHTFVTALISAGIHPKTTQMLARHGDIRLTLDRYVHVLGERQIAAVNLLPNLSVRPKTAGA
jgi:integrase